ncbi:SRPBCC domain-containing protein [Amycolatopsis alba]|uniref:Polyketide cyclase n=1 Tax=Amycolatopsis alba DSM 44262 TaxID=1125972 RepID=A0A229RTT1_AMYAL|nr:SRPBCC domain-containing protein [Amycolatopsis alba]OXM49911.1 polyketide cyclase [Amycolatopsis alba DSM 44262]
MTVKHATFTLERVYPVSPERVFAAWADPAAKAGWFTVPGGGHSLDFRVGGREVTSGPPDDGKGMVFDARYEDIAENERIVYSGTLSANDVLATVSVTTVLLEAEGDGTRLTLIEQGTFLDGQEEPSWREQGTGTWLDNLGKVFSAV